MTKKSVTIKKLFYLIYRKPRLLAVFTCAICASAVLESMGIGSLYPMFDLLQREEKKVYYLEKIKQIIPVDISPERFVIFLFIGIACLFLLKGIIQISAIYLKFKLAETLKAGFQSDIFDNYLDKEYDYFIKHNTGDLIQRQMTHTENAGQAVLHSCQFVMNLIVFLCLYIVMWVVSLKISLIITVVMVLLVVFSLLFSKLKIYLLSLEYAELQKKLFSMATEVFIGIRQVKAFTGEEFFKNRFLKSVKRKAQIVIKNHTYAQSPGPTIQTIVLLSFVIGLFFTIYYADNKENILPLFGFFAAATYRISTVLAAINSDIMQLGHFMPSVEIVADLLQIEEQPGQECLLKSGLREIRNFNDPIRFEHVSFSYPGKNFKIEDLNLEIKKGKFYGIVGPSGSGKSTFVDLIIKFYRPQSGRILADGIPLDELDTISWRNKIGLVSQDTFVFNGTVEQNILFAKGVTEKNKDIILNAAKIADIEDVITELPQGYKTEIGERGLTLSGGQRQRLSIARAVAKDPDIYIFDEATSSLDTYSEQRIQTAIENLSKTYTVIAIAHRLSTVINADEIVVLNNGRVVERGNHEFLMKKKGVYTRLYMKQYSGSANNT
ncbi:MAG: ABC transporter ATP-binding protein [bacterium]